MDARAMRDFYEHLDRTLGTHRELADLAIMRLLDLKDDLENGDESVARILEQVEQEPEMRNFMAHDITPVHDRMHRTGGIAAGCSPCPSLSRAGDRDSRSRRGEAI